MFLLDENMPRRVLLALQTAGYDATRVHTERLTAQPDPAVVCLRLPLEEQQSTITRKDFGP